MSFRFWTNLPDAFQPSTDWTSSFEASITPDDESNSTLPAARRTGMPITEQSDASKSASALNFEPEKSHFAEPFSERPRLNSKS